MKIQLFSLAALLASVPQASVNEMDAQEPGSYAPRKSIHEPQFSANILDLCGELEEEQARSCSSACASSGKDHKYENAICGIGSTCKCV